MGVRAVQRMAAIGCVRRVGRATTIGVANMEVVAACITGVPTEVAKVNVALASAQER
jgi:spore maturation protein SpmA